MMLCTPLNQNMAARALDHFAYGTRYVYLCGLGRARELDILHEWPRESDFAPGVADLRHADPVI